MNNIKFAFLIMAHNNYEQLKILLNLLDFKNNEIYLHIDKKSSTINQEDLFCILKKAKLHVYKKFYVYYADISQTECQTFLLEEACKSYHDYYHLISNADLPIKTQKYIEKFFLENKGKQFVHFESLDYCNKENCIYYHFFYTMISKTRIRFLKKILRKLEKISIFFQKKLKVKRKLYCGANWYSITHDLAIDFCKNKKIMLSKVKWTISSDEYILQTFIRKFASNKYYIYPDNSILEDDYRSVARLIDWKRGFPYVWKKKDEYEILNSQALFARKFDIEVDKYIINAIVNKIKNE